MKNILMVFFTSISCECLIYWGLKIDTTKLKAVQKNAIFDY